MVDYDIIFTFMKLIFLLNTTFLICLRGQGFINKRNRIMEWHAATGLSKATK